MSFGDFTDQPPYGSFRSENIHAKIIDQIIQQNDFDRSRAPSYHETTATTPETETKVRKDCFCWREAEVNVREYNNGDSYMCISFLNTCLCDSGLYPRQWSHVWKRETEVILLDPELGVTADEAPGEYGELNWPENPKVIGYDSRAKAEWHYQCCSPCYSTFLSPKCPCQPSYSLQDPLRPSKVCFLNYGGHVPDPPSPGYDNNPGGISDEDLPYVYRQPEKEFKSVSTGGPGYTAEDALWFAEHLMTDSFCPCCPEL